MKLALSFKILLVLAGLPLLSGCALFSSKEDAPAAAAGFQGVAQTTSGSLPLPVEVAHDISRIYNGEAPAVQPEPVPVDDDERIVNESPSKRSPASTHSRRSTSQSKSSKGRPLKAGSPEDYVVKDGDTLMKISFEKYGNLYRWREIYDSNKSKIGNYNKLVAGTILNIRGVEYVVIEHNGKPYLIRRNDTLTKISNNVYGTPKEWRALWENNRQLIRDPNKIYAGFTMYYLPKDQLGQPRGPASTSKKKTASVEKPKVVGQTVTKPSRETQTPEAQAPVKEVALISDDPGQLPPPAPPSRLPKSQ